MKITFDRHSDVIDYRVHDFELKYTRLLEMCFYRKTPSGYIKSYPGSSRYLDRMMTRYALYAKTMFDQLGYFTSVPWKEGLDAFCSIIEKTDMDWWLTGSCAACIRGIDLSPHDVDIMINSDDIPELTELFRDELIEPIVSTHGWLTKDFGVMFLHCRIDIASDPSPVLDVPEPIDCGPYAKDHLEVVRWNGHQVKVPPLALQIAANRARGRTDRVGLMEAFLGT